MSAPSQNSKKVKVRDPNAATIPEFTVRMKDCETSEGRTAIFECQIHGTPQPLISFYRGTKELFEAGKYKITQDGDKYMLAINNVQLNDEDEYSVKAKNKGGSRMSRAYLTVKCPPKINLPER